MKKYASISILFAGLLLAAQSVVAAPQGAVDSATGMTFVSVPAGCFQMGDNSDKAEDEEKPVHEVCLSGFQIGTYEVTQGQWKKVMGNNPSGFKQCGDNCPVENVSWTEVQGFIGKLNALSKASYRLPTEAEWEYAARSGGKQETYSGGNDAEKVAWFEANSDQKTSPVGKKQPNGLGIYDMSGNVWEWTADFFAEDFYANSPRQNPTGPAAGKFRVNRGGSWYVESTGVRTTVRGSNEPDKRTSNLGFRLVLPSK